MKQTTVKNPLTVIAIFAATAEVSGAAVLPLLQQDQQKIYLYFLIAFPFLIGNYQGRSQGNYQGRGTIRDVLNI